jgi:hypothetical protein
MTLVDDAFATHSRWMMAMATERLFVIVTTTA